MTTKQYLNQARTLEYAIKSKQEDYIALPKKADICKVSPSQSVFRAVMQTTVIPLQVHQRTRFFMGDRVFQTGIR